MKKFLLPLLLTLPTTMSAQSLVPTKTKSNSELGATPTFKEQIFPFRSKKALRGFYDEDSRYLTGLSVAAIRPGLGDAKTNSVYVELVSVVPELSVFRLSLGTNMAQTALKDSSKSQQELALQKLTNGGGNLVLNLNRPFFFRQFGEEEGDSFLLGSLDLTGYADIDEFNQSTYDPGWGIQLNPNFDYRIFDTKEKQPIRFGLNARWQYNVFNKKYGNTNSVDNSFNNLGILSTGLYLGIAMFNIQVNYNVYNKKDDFFKERRWLLRVELIPFKF